MRQILKISILSIFFLTVYFFLFSSGIIKYLALGSSYYFGDYQIFVNALNCYNQGLSPYNGPKELNCSGFNYGHVVLFFTIFRDFITGPNYLLIPFTFIFLFTTLTVNLINPKNNFQYFICALALLNPATLLLIERMNLDILLYLILIFISFNRIYFINWLLVIYSFLFKFFPFIFGMIIFVEKNDRKIMSFFGIFLFIFLTSLIFILFFKDEYSLMFEDSKGWKMGLHYLFSIKSIPKVFKEAFTIHYGFSLLFFYLFFIYFIYKNYKSNYQQLEDSYNFEKKLFLLSSNSLIFFYLVSSNAFYKEVFLILTIPYLLNNLSIKKFRYILNILCIKLLFNFIYTLDLNFETFYHLENVRIYKTHFLIITFLKGLIDYLLIMYLGTITMKLNINLFKSLKKKLI